MQGGAWKILLVEDDEDDYVITRTHLMQALDDRFELLWADSYAQGREILLRRPDLDVVLIDYQLGSENGLNLVTEFIEQGYATPFIMVTGFTGYDLDVHAMQVGVVEFLTKRELTPVTLERAIRYAIQRHQVEEQLRQAASDLKFLAASAVRFLSCRPEDDLFEVISQQLETLRGDLMMLVSEYNPEKNLTRIIKLLSSQEDRERALQLVGDPVGLELPFNDKVRDLLAPGQLRWVVGGLFELAQGAIPKELCEMIESELNLQSVYSIPFASPAGEGDDFLGTLVVLSHHDHLPENKETLEAFTSQAGIALQRWRTEQERERLLQRLRQARGKVE